MALVFMQQLARYLQRELSDIYSPGEIVALSRLLFHELREGLPSMVATGKCNHLSATYSRAASFLMNEGGGDIPFFRPESVPRDSFLMNDGGRDTPSWDVGKVGAVAEVVRRLKTGEPVQYIVGRTEFHGLMLHVTPDVLIPRPETEELVAWVLDELPPGKLKLLDVGTGSGCIAVVLGKIRPGSEVYACDVSERAITVAQRNARENGVDVHFFVQDILAPLPVSPHLFSPVTSTVSSSITRKGVSLDVTPALAFENGSFHAVISNPPYVLESEQEAMEANVLNHEPAEALFVPDRTPLLFYERIADFSLSLLGEGGLLFFEVNRNKGEEVRAILLERGYRNVELRSDMAGNPRMVRAVKP